MHMRTAVIFRTCDSTRTTQTSYHGLQKRNILIFKHRAVHLDFVQVTCSVAVFLVRLNACIGHNTPSSAVLIVDLVLVVAASDMLNRTAKHISDSLCSRAAGYSRHLNLNAEPPVFDTFKVSCHDLTSFH